MKRKRGIASSFLFVVFVSAGVQAQRPSPPKPGAEPTMISTPAVGITITAATTPVDLARAALASQGGDKFKNLKSMVLIGTVELYPPNSTQSIPGKFAIVSAGDKVRIDIDARPIMSFKQVFDGVNTYSSTPGSPLPPPAKFGLAVLAKFDQPGYTVAALPDNKKRRGFRIADGEGNSTDFYLDPATGQVLTFLFSYGGNTFGTEYIKMKEVDGVLVPYSFSQRFDMALGTVFSQYTVKEARLNQPLGDDVFLIPN